MVDPGLSITLSGIIDVITTNGCCHDPELDMTPEKWARVLGLRLSASDQDLRIYYHGIELPDGTKWTTQTCSVKVIDDEVTTRIEYSYPEGSSQIIPLTLTQATTHTLNFVAENPQRFETLGGMPLPANARETTGVTIKVVVKPVFYRVPSCLSNARGAQKASLTSTTETISNVWCGTEEYKVHYTYCRIQHVATRFERIAGAISACGQTCFGGTANFEIGTVRANEPIDGVTLQPEVKVGEVVGLGLGIALTPPHDELGYESGSFAGVMATAPQGLYVRLDVWQLARVYYVEKYTAEYSTGEVNPFISPRPFVAYKQSDWRLKSDILRENVDPRNFYLPALTYASQLDLLDDRNSLYPQCASFGKENWTCGEPPELPSSILLQ